MDIFTPFCINRASNKVEPTRFRVKALSREERVHALSDKFKELIDEESRKHKQEAKDGKEEQLEQSATSQANNTDDDDEHHLDIYV